MLRGWSDHAVKPFNLLGVVYAKEFEVIKCLHVALLMRMGPYPAWFLLKSTIGSFVLLTLRERLFTWHHAIRVPTSSLYAVLVIRPTTDMS